MNYATAWENAFKDFDRFFVGMDQYTKKLTNIAEQSSKLAQNFPPYNIKKIDDSVYLIELAVAGFDESDIDIELANGTLTIKGNVKPSEDYREDNGEYAFPVYVHKGIAQRSFTRQFTLADNVEVKGADLQNGMLRVTLEAIIPESKKPRKIAITGQSAQPRLTESKEK
jgi:molecular chaperone IbpA